VAKLQHDLRSNPLRTQSSHQCSITPVSFPSSVPPRSRAMAASCYHAHETYGVLPASIRAPPASAGFNRMFGLF